MIKLMIKEDQGRSYCRVLNWWDAFCAKVTKVETAIMSKVPGVALVGRICLLIAFSSFRTTQTATQYSYSTSAGRVANHVVPQGGRATSAKFTAN